MGRQKQLRRSAKKKQKGGGGGHNKAAAGAKNEAKDEAAPTLKCTACRQVVTVNTSIACPVPECDRIFCTKKCASSCILRCTREDCPCPERCRPCASGKILFLIARRDGSGEKLSKLVASMISDCCEERVCSHCIDRCGTCRKSLCSSCARTDGPNGTIACTYSRCSAKYCSSACLPGSLDTRWSACGKCVAGGAFVSEGGEHVGVIKGSAVDWVVLEYAKELALSLKFVVALSTMYVSTEIARKAEINEFTSKAIKRVLESISQETTPRRRFEGAELILGTAQRYVEEDRAIQLVVKETGPERTHLHDGVMGGLLPKITTTMGSFPRLRNLLLSEESIRRLEGILLDVMQKLFESRLCGHCFRQVKNASPQRCGGCKAIYYCNESCQALSWPTHFQHCACMKDARKEYNKNVLEKNASKGLPQTVPQAASDHLETNETD